MWTPTPVGWIPGYVESLAGPVGESIVFQHANYRLRPSIKYHTLRIQTLPDRAGFMIETSHPQNRNISEIPFSGHIWILGEVSQGNLDVPPVCVTKVWPQEICIQIPLRALACKVRMGPGRCCCTPPCSAPHHPIKCANMIYKENTQCIQANFAWCIAYWWSLIDRT